MENQIRDLSHLGIRQLKEHIDELATKITGERRNFFGRPVKYLNYYECQKAALVLDLYNGSSVIGDCPSKLWCMDEDGGWSTETMIRYIERIAKLTVPTLPQELLSEKPKQTKGKIKAGHGILESAIFECVESALEGHKGGGVDEEEVNRLIKNYMANVPAKKIQINDLPEVEVEGVVHKQFEKIFSYLMAGHNIRLVGPTGSGKTHLVQQLVAARNKALQEEKPMYALSCTEETTRSDFVGRIFPTVDSDGNPKVEFLDGPITRSALEGAICLIDEEDAARANVKAALFPLLENGILPVPGRPQGQVVNASKGCQIIANANTFGNGADLAYCGREKQDRAWLNRFQMTTFYLDYDKDMENQLATAEVCSWAWDLREELSAKKLRRCISTRDMIKMSEIIKQGLDSLDDLKFRYFQSWEKSERNKVASKFIPGGL